MHNEQVLREILTEDPEPVIEPDTGAPVERWWSFN
jgi:hypothetical protein